MKLQKLVALRALAIALSCAGGTAAQDAAAATSNPLNNFIGGVENGAAAINSALSAQSKSASTSSSTSTSGAPTSSSSSTSSSPSSTSPTSTARPASSGAAAAAAASASSSAAAAAASKHHGLSGGAIAGIVIGAILGVGILIGLLVALCCCCILPRRRRRREHQYPDGYAEKSAATAAGPGMAASSRPWHTSRANDNGHSYVPVPYDSATGHQQHHERRDSSYSVPLNQHPTIPLSAASAIPPGRQSQAPSLSQHPAMRTQAAERDAFPDTLNGNQHASHHSHHGLETGAAAGAAAAGYAAHKHNEKHGNERIQQTPLIGQNVSQTAGPEHNAPVGASNHTNHHLERDAAAGTAAGFAAHKIHQDHSDEHNHRAPSMGQSGQEAATREPIANAPPTHHSHHGLETGAVGGFAAGTAAADIAQKRHGPAGQSHDQQEPLMAHQDSQIATRDYSTTADPTHHSNAGVEAGAATGLGAGAAAGYAAHKHHQEHEDLRNLQSPLIDRHERDSVVPKHVTAGPVRNEPPTAPNVAANTVLPVSNRAGHTGPTHSTAPVTGHQANANAVEASKASDPATAQVTTNSESPADPVVTKRHSDLATLPSARRKSGSHHAADAAVVGGAAAFAAHKHAERKELRRQSASSSRSQSRSHSRPRSLLLGRNSVDRPPTPFGLNDLGNPYESKHTDMLQSEVPSAALQESLHNREERRRSSGPYYDDTDHQHPQYHGGSPATNTAEYRGVSHQSPALHDRANMASSRIASLVPQESSHSSLSTGTTSASEQYTAADDPYQPAQPNPSPKFAKSGARPTNIVPPELPWEQHRLRDSGGTLPSASSFNPPPVPWGNDEYRSKESSYSGGQNSHQRNFSAPMNAQRRSYDASRERSTSTGSNGGQNTNTVTARRATPPDMPSRKRLSSSPATGINGQRHTTQFDDLQSNSSSSLGQSHTPPSSSVSPLPTQQQNNRFSLGSSASPTTTTTTTTTTTAPSSLSSSRPASYQPLNHHKYGQEQHDRLSGPFSDAFSDAQPATTFPAGKGKVVDVTGPSGDGHGAADYEYLRRSQGVGEAM